MGLPFPIGPIQDMNISGIRQLRREGSVAWSSSVSNKLWVIYLSHRVQDKKKFKLSVLFIFFLFQLIQCFGRLAGFRRLYNMNHIGLF